MLQIPTAIITRFGPWFKSVMKLDSAFLSRYIAALRAKGVQIGETFDDVVKFFKSSKTNAVLTMGTIASMGYSITDLFSPEDVKDPEVRGLKTDLDTVLLTSLSAETGHSYVNDPRVVQAVEQSEMLKGISGSETDLAMLSNILSWARAHYGGQQGAIRAHAMNQAFMELSSNDVEAGFRTLRIR